MKEANEKLIRIIDLMSSGQQNRESDSIDALLQELLAETEDRTQLEPEIGIVESTLEMQQGRYEQALVILRESRKADPNNYELAFSAALCLEQLGREEAAYYNFKLAIYLSRGSQDTAVIEEEFQHFCGYAQADGILLERSLKDLIEQRLELHEYQKTYEFLQETLYDRNKVAAETVLSEDNMLLFMMLEITLCEQNYLPADAFAKDNTCMRYHNHVEEFKRAFTEVRFLARRIWFGLSMMQQNELIQVLAKYPISGDMLAVVTKYSVLQEYWQDIYARMSQMLMLRYPMIAIELDRYRQVLKQREIGGELQCTQPDEVVPRHAEQMEVYQLDCRANVCRRVDSDAEGKDDTSYLTVIYCTNDEIYNAEVKRYLERMIIPNGMKLRVIEVWNASGMAAGYNKAMKFAGPGIKLYIHHDTFFIDKNALCSIVETFESNVELGMLGIAGTLHQPENGYWWRSEKQNIRMIVYQDAILNIVQSMTIKPLGAFEDADAMDGILLATSVDVEWREDLFDGWHFYDISQCYEMRKAGKRVCLLNSDHFWVMHETTMKKDANHLYEKYCGVFRKEYLN